MVVPEGYSLGVLEGVMDIGAVLQEQNDSIK